MGTVDCATGASSTRAQFNSARPLDVAVAESQERKDTQKAMLYDLRLIIKASEKENYTKEELLDLFDTIAAAKDQE